MIPFLFAQGLESSSSVEWRSICNFLTTAFLNPFWILVALAYFAAGTEQGGWMDRRAVRARQVLPGLTVISHPSPSFEKLPGPGIFLQD